MTHNWAMYMLCGATALLVKLTQEAPFNGDEKANLELVIESLEDIADDIRVRRAMERM